MDPKVFYGKVVHHRLLREAVEFLETSKVETADVVIVGPPEGGEDSDIEAVDDDNMVEDPCMPAEVAGEIDVFCNVGDDEEEFEEPPQPKRAKSSVKWKKRHLACGGTSAANTKDYLLFLRFVFKIEKGWFARHWNDT